MLNDPFCVDIDDPVWLTTLECATGSGHDLTFCNRTQPDNLKLQLSLLTRKAEIICCLLEIEQLGAGYGFAEEEGWFSFYLLLQCVGRE